MEFFDLNFPFPFSGYNTPNLRFGGGHYEYGENSLFSIDAFSPTIRVQQMCPTLPGRQEGTSLLLLESIPLPGLCPVEPAGIPARPRSIFEFSSPETLSHGSARPNSSFHPGRCQRKTRLPHLPRFCLYSYPPSYRTLPGRRIARQYCSRTLCPRFNHHRPVPLPLSLGTLPESQSRHQASYLTRPPGFHPHIYCGYRRKNSRCQPHGCCPHTSPCRPSHGPWIPRLRTPLPHPSDPRLLCHPRQNQSQVPENLIPAHRQKHRSPVRPDHCPDRKSLQNRLSRTAAPGTILRLRAEQKTLLSDQQLLSQRQHGSRHLPLPLASRTILQMDQGTPPNQSFLRHLTKRSQNPNLDRHQCLSLGSNHKKAIESFFQSTHFFANS